MAAARQGLDGDGGPLAVAIADDARERSGIARERQRIVGAWRSARERHGHAGIGRDQQPGVARVRAALLLAALGRAGESRQSLRRVFLYPDRNLSHAMARAAMNDARPDRGDKK